MIFKGKQRTTRRSCCGCTLRGTLLTLLVLVTATSLAMNLAGGLSGLRYAVLANPIAQRTSNWVSNVGIQRCDADPAALKPIVFLHLHKAMGTSICAMAKEAECITQYQRSHNCNLRADGTKAMTTSTGLTCGERLTVGMEQQESLGIMPTFYGVERFMDPEICREDFTYLVVFRKPLDRIVSHWAMHYKPRKSGERRTIFKDVENFAPKRERGGRRSSWTATSKTTLNNFYIRSLLGVDAYTTKRRIGPTHLEAAKARLLQFHYVLTLERFAEAGPVFELLGWTQQFEDMTKRGERQNARTHTSFEDTFDAREQSWLIAHNKLDEELYTFAEHLFDVLLAAQS